MLLERRTVSRKTPADGRLEITDATAQRLALLGGELPVIVDRTRGVGRVTSMPCACRRRGEGAAHVHHFLQSALFQRLVPEASVRVELDESTGAVRISERD